MTRYGMVIGLKPETEEKYKQYHAAVWPGVLEMIRKCNIRNYSIYLKDHTLYSYFEYHGDRLRSRYGEDGRRQDDAGVVGDHGAHAESAADAERGRMVVRDGRSVSPGLRTLRALHLPQSLRSVVPLRK